MANSGGDAGVEGVDLGEHEGPNRVEGQNLPPVLVPDGDPRKERRHSEDRERNNDNGQQHESGPEHRVMKGRSGKQKSAEERSQCGSLFYAFPKVLAPK